MLEERKPSCKGKIIGKWELCSQINFSTIGWVEGSQILDSNEREGEREGESVGEKGRKKKLVSIKGRDNHVLSEKRQIFQEHRYHILLLFYGVVFPALTVGFS